MSHFKLVSPYRPTGDQPEAIAQLVEGLRQGDQAQVLLGVTGSGKTFTVANVIEQIDRPTLVLSHNKTLAAQLYDEFQGFFPDNAVQYFVSYYDYYQPEAYISATDTYIEKDLAINEELDRLRLSSTMALMSGRRDIVIVASVSCIYGLGNPTDFYSGVVELKPGTDLDVSELTRRLQDAQYVRDDIDFIRGRYRTNGNVVDVFPVYEDFAYRIRFAGHSVEELEAIDPRSGQPTAELDTLRIFPANLFLTPQDKRDEALQRIRADVNREAMAFRQRGMEAEAQRLEERVTCDIEMIKELGYCPGIENYSRYFDGRQPGQRPYCLFDYFPSDFLLVVDESHVTVPQLRAMYGGDRSRKDSLVQYGFRLEAARDNRPLKFEEFEAITKQTIYVSATPADYELKRAGGVVVEQLVRPTGLLDPEIIIRPSLNQIDDLLAEVKATTRAGERSLITTLTKRMAEELTDYLSRCGVVCTYIHSDVDTLDRVEIMQKLRKGELEAIVGVNLLREGLDMPEVSLVAILDADKEGFLRNERSLTQTAGRAARNVHGRVIMYADRITEAMQRTIDATDHRRRKQMEYNRLHHVTPRGLEKAIGENSLIKGRTAAAAGYAQGEEPAEVAAELVAETAAVYGRPSARAATTIVDAETTNDPEDLRKTAKELERQMKKAAKELDFLQAAQYRDQLNALKKRIQAL